MWLDTKAVKVSTTAECVEVICFHIVVLPNRRKSDDKQVFQSQKQYVLRFKEYVESVNKEKHPKDLEELVAHMASLTASSKDGDIQGLDQDRRAEAHAGGSQDLQAPHVGAQGVQGELVTSPFLA